MNKSIYIILALLYCLFLFAEDSSMDLAKIDFYIKIKDFQKASEKLKEINISQIPEQKKALFFNKAGFINYKLNKLEKALYYYSLAIKLDPSLAFVYNNIGVIYFACQKYKKAKEFYLEAIQRQAEYPKALINLAIVNFYLKNYKSSYQYFKKALSLNQEYIKKRFNEKKALKKLEEWAHQNPDDKDIQKMLEWARKNTHRDITKIDFIEEYL